MNSSAPTARAAPAISSRVASGRPKAMFSATVPAKRKPSCGTIPSWRRSDSCVRVTQVAAVDEDRTVGRVVEAREQLGDRRLAGARMADERDGRAGRDVEVDPVQHLAAGGVAETDAVEPDVAEQPRQLAGVSGVGHLRLLDEHLHDLVEGGDRREEGAVELRELLHRIEEARRVAEERGQHAVAGLRREDEVGAVAEDDRGRERREEVDEREVEGVLDDGLLVAAPVGLADEAEVLPRRLARA